MRRVRLPTSKLALLLLGLGFQRQGAELETSADSQWVSYRWTGPRGGNAMVSVEAAEPELVAILERIVSTPAAFVELAALLVALATHAGVVGGWAYERAAELLYGPRTPKSHRGREVPRLRNWLRLMAEGWWRIDIEEPAPKARKGRAPKPPARTRIDGPLLRIDGRTLHPGEALAGALRSAMFATVPVSIFLLVRGDHHNPHGNLPSIAAQARMRIGAAIAARWRDATGQRVRAEELLEDWAGLDLAPVRERRRTRTWTRTLEAVLGDDGHEPARLGPRTEWDERSPLRSLLELVIAAPRRPARSSGQPGSPSG